MCTMHMIESSFNQRGPLQLPAASLVIDIRPNNNSVVINRLKIEINDIANEMKAHEVFYWRNLTDFLAFMSITPMNASDIETLRSPASAQAVTQTTKATT